MAVQVEKVSPIKTRLTLTIEAAAVAAEKEKTLKTIRREAMVPGFRPGKAPLDLIKRRYASYLDDEVKRTLLKERLPQAITEEKIKTLGAPELEKEEFAENGDLIFVAVLETWPEVVLGEYKGIEVKREKTDVRPEAVDGRIERFRLHLATFTPVTDRDVCEKGDMVEVDYTGRKDGEVFKGGSHKDFKLELGSGTFIPGFEDALMGMKVGETKEVPLTFPEAHGRPDLSGQPVVFTVTLKSIVKRELPALDDEFAKDTGLADTFEALKQKVHDEIFQAEEGRTKRGARRSLVNKLVELYPIEVPQDMVERQQDQMVRSTKVELAQAGMQISDDPALDERLRARYADEAKKEVQCFFLFQAIAEKENIVVSDADLELKYLEIAARQGRPVAEVSAYYQKENFVEYLKDGMLDDKVVDFLLANANIVWEEPVAHSEHEHEHEHEHDHEHDHDDSHE